MTTTTKERRAPTSGKRYFAKRYESKQKPPHKNSQTLALRAIQQSVSGSLNSMELLSHISVYSGSKPKHKGSNPKMLRKLEDANIRIRNRVGERKMATEPREGLHNVIEDVIKPKFDKVTKQFEGVAKQFDGVTKQFQETDGKIETLEQTIHKDITSLEETFSKEIGDLKTLLSEIAFNTRPNPKP